MAFDASAISLREAMDKMSGLPEIFLFLTFLLIIF